MIEEESGPEDWQGRQVAPTDVSIDKLDILATCTHPHAFRTGSRWFRRATTRAWMFAWTSRSPWKSGAASLSTRGGRSVGSGIVTEVVE
jgi:hypothetical protein